MFKVEVHQMERPVGDGGGKDVLTKLAAGTCYQSSPEKAAKVDVDIKQLWGSKHHTTFQHNKHYVTFNLDDIPVSLVTFGLHMIHPYYNTSQRSGRYCTKMFDRGLGSMVDEFVDRYYPMVCADHKGRIREWVESGVDFFQAKLGEATDLAKNALRIERKYYVNDIDKQAKRIAQEQLRNFISTIVPTGLLYTVNVTTIAAMAKAAWNSPMRDLMKKMVDKAFIEGYVGELDGEDWNPTFEALTRNVWDTAEVVDRPGVFVKPIAKSKMNYWKIEQMLMVDSEVDVLPFSPHFADMNYSTPKCRSHVNLSVASYGQEQRHRSIKRGLPVITGDFYLPPLLHLNTKWQEFAKHHMIQYNKLVKDVGADVMIHFIPYGATVSYYRESNLASWIHAARLRLCWNAQEEISQLERSTMVQLIKDGKHRFDAPCSVGKCPEGNRYCGRDLLNRVHRKLI